MRRGVSRPSFTGVGDVDTVVTIGFVTEAVVTTGVGNCRLLQAVCVPLIGAVVGVAFPKPPDPWLDEEAVGLTCDAILLESMVGVFVIRQLLDPLGIRAND